MKRLLLIALALLGLTCTSVPVEPVDAANRKQVFDGMLHANRPDLYGLYGFRELDFISPNNRAYLLGLWPDFTTAAPAAWMDALAANYTHPDNILLLDMESYPVGTQGERQAATTKLVAMAVGMKTRRPELKIGFYAYPHMSEYFDVLGNTAASLPGGVDYVAFQAKNDDFAPLWAVVDYIFPTIYYPYNREEAPAAPISQPYIHNYFYHNLLDTIRCRTAYGRPDQPIISYVWYANVSTHHIDQDVWEDMIRTAYTMGDGLILWSINTAPSWDKDAWWWKQFLAQFPFGDRTPQRLRVKEGDLVVEPPREVVPRSIATAVTNATSITWNHTNNASVNADLVVTVAFNDAVDPTITATYNGVAMTLIENHQLGTDGVAAFNLVNPPTGTFAVVVSAGATVIDNMVGFGISFQGVHQTTPFRTAMTGSFATGSQVITVTNSQNGDLIVTADILANLNMRGDSFQDMSVTRDVQLSASNRSAVMTTRYSYGTNQPVGLRIDTPAVWRGLAFSLVPIQGITIPARPPRP